jgi:hypothetical protein
MIGDVINRIDAVLNSKQAVSDEDLAALESILAKLKEKNAAR